MKSDLVFGLIAPLGASLDSVEQQLRDQLSAFGYRIETIHLSSIITELYRDHYPSQKIKERFCNCAKDLERICLLQDGGDVLRIDTQRGDILAIAAISRIVQLRKEMGNGPCVYLIRSLKHPEELSLLRDTYQERFYTVSAFSSRQRRIDHLQSFLKGDGGDDALAQRLVDRDYRRGNEELIDDRLDSAFSLNWFTGQDADRAEVDLQKFGQQLQGTFYQSDLFVDSSDDPLTKRHVKRFVELIFGNPFATPTKEEFAMFQAKSVSLRSADLSRQVGAVIATPSGDVIASGANEVPKFGGGLHWASSTLEEEGESRDFHFFKGEEIDALRMSNLMDVLKQLAKEGWQFSKRGDADGSKEKSSVESLARRLRELHISQMGDFGRTVHAEMAALMDAVSRGVCVGGQTAYVTTFPCHQCAKHLIAAGIERVVFIEPYPKSETVKLWPSEVANFEVDATAKDDRMHLLPFVGIAPRRYSDFFLFEPQKSPRRVIRDGVRRVARWEPKRPAHAANSSVDKDSSCLAREKILLNVWAQWFKSSGKPN